MYRQVISILQKELLQEVRHKSGFMGIIIYSIASIYCSYLAFRQVIDIPVWNALLWIIILFSATNAIAKSFLNESRGEQLLYFSLLNPTALIIAKAVYNVLLLLIITAINFAAYSILLGNSVQNMPLFAGGLFLGVSALGLILTLVSALAARAGNSASLMAILGFPLIIPTLITAIRFSSNAIDGQTLAVNQPYFIVLISLNVLIFTLILLLFPYLWRE
jgi:heme exporter protein B